MRQDLPWLLLASTVGIRADACGHTSPYVAAFGIKQKVRQLD